MKARDDSERKQLRGDRAASGYTSARLSRETLALLRELLKVTPRAYGLDELLYELATAERQRRQLVERIRAEGEK